MKDKLRKFRIWWGSQDYRSEVIEAETAEDALTIAKVNFARNGLTPVKIEAER